MNHALLDGAFTALADPTRRAAVEILRKGPRRAGDLARQLGSTPAGLSRHLRVLRESGLVAQEVSSEDARVRFLRLERKPFDALRHWVEDVETFWSGQLASFRVHAEKTRGNHGQ
ncbi:MAG TPA: metalloregulator ArsR/SmtB family transcription factor [Polyangiaceae bacterium]|nr:metalloregulator ArsR/SmtB family transcription factor [Polyangiaceae bacterium]